MKNEYKVIDDTVTIYMRRRNGDVFETIIDLDDLESIRKLNFSWHVSWCKKIKGYYVAATEYLGMIDGKPKYQRHLLHRKVLKPNNEQCVDHINYDTLDNRRENLRLSTKVTNSKHKNGMNKNNTSGYRNVSKIGNKWVVQLQVDGKNRRLGGFEDIHEAGAFAEKMRSRYYGEFAGRCDGIENLKMH